MLLVSAFLLTSLVVFISVFLKRAEALGKEGLVRTVDRYVIIAYPLGYMVAVGLIALIEMVY